MRSTLLSLSLCSALTLACASSTSSSGSATNADGSTATKEAPKPPTAETKAANAAVLKELPFGDKTDFENAKKGLIAPLPDNGVVKNAKGDVVWDSSAFAFIGADKACPDTVNPSLWRISQLMSISGLFKVVDRVYQVRGLDLSVITFIEGKSGVIIVDPLISAETAAVALKLYQDKVGKGKPVAGVIYTHSHVDHFGGVRGVTNDADVKAKKCVVVAPEGFTEEAVSENVMAGNVMGRRASYMYGNMAAPGPMGQVGAGLGTTTSAGTVTLIEPTHFIKKTGEKLTIDGLEFEFLMAPGSEAPSEMHFYVAELKALCTAENACHTLHNFYTLRGAKTRDSRKWVGYLNETLTMWGDKAEVLFAPHHWPTWGNANIVEHIKKYRDTFKYIHDQSLRMANQGYTMIEIGEKIELPPSLSNNWASRGYYGTVNHNAKAVYNLYLGYFDANPSTLHQLAPVEASAKYVEFMGGAGDVLEKAQKSFDAGDYRWAAQVVNHVVLADPKNHEARNFLADTLEQLGYQAEGGVWRNFYLCGAAELRNGVRKGATPATASPDVIRSMPLGEFLDFVALQVEPKKAAGKKLAINLNVSDVKETFALSLENSVINYFPNKQTKDADCTLTIPRTALNDVMLRTATIADKVKSGDAKIEGNGKALEEFVGTLEPFDFWFEIVTSNTNKGG
jgi:alkyl sulfatase BDS1-like metallo-beta-lactamase superfamily hydrolase